MLNARGSVRRSLVFWTPGFVAAAALWVYVVAQPLTGGDSAVAGIVIVTPIFALLAWHFVNIVRDQWAPIVDGEGEVRKKWSRFDLPFSRSYYVYVGSNVFKVPRDVWGQVLPGDRVSVRYLPNTATLEQIELLSGSGRAP